MRRFRLIPTTVALCAALAFSAGCADDSTTGDTPDEGSVDDGGGSTDSDGGAADADDKDAGGDEDAGGVEDTDGGGSSSSGGPDVPKVKDTGEVDCSSDNWCINKLAADLSACETAKCVLSTGKCEKIKKKDACCNDAHCEPPTPCVKGKCDLGINKCVFEQIKPAPTGCGGGTSVVYLDEDFEQGCNPAPADWSQTPTQGVGNVKWHCSTNRAHTGKASLYLGNECKNYDTSATDAAGCKGGSGKQVQIKLASKEVTVPKGKQAIAHFWLWLDSESIWTANDKLKEAAKKKPLTSGTACKTKAGAEPNKCGAKALCAFGQTCVNLSGVDQCLDERDDLKLYVQTGGKKLAVWNSSCIGKTTSGKWIHQLVDMTPYLDSKVGTAFKLIFEFDTKTGSLNGYEGAYIDDLRIEDLKIKEKPKDEGGGFMTCDKITKCPETEKNTCDIEACTLALNLGSPLGLCFNDQTPGCCNTVFDCDDNNTCTLDSCNIPKGKSEGTCSSVPDASNPQCCKPSSTFKETFDTGAAGNWTTADCNSKSVKWHVNKNSPYKGAQSLCFSDQTGTGYDDPSLKPKGPRCTMCSPKVKIAHMMPMDRTAMAALRAWLFISLRPMALSVAKTNSPPPMSMPSQGSVTRNSVNRP